MSSPRVNDLNYCELTRNVDNMLHVFSKDRKKVINMLINDTSVFLNMMWTTNSPICMDDYCLFNMNSSENPGTTGTEDIDIDNDVSINNQKNIDEDIDEDLLSDTLIQENQANGDNERYCNYYVCAQCKNMKRLLDFEKTELGKPFLIECGNRAGDELIIIKDKISKLYVLKDLKPETVMRTINSPYINNLPLCTNIDINLYSNILYLGSDPFTNNLLITWYLMESMNKLNMPNILNMEIGFVCSNNGYSLYEYPDIGRLRHIQKYPELLSRKVKNSPTAKGNDIVSLSYETVKGILMQLFASLRALNDKDFSHGFPTSRSILFSNNPCSYKYDGVHVASPVTLKLTNFHNSGITIENKIRLYSKSVLADRELLSNSFKPNIVKTNDGEIVYILKDPNKYVKESMLFMYIRHLGLPIYQNSYDAYSFMISLMSDKSFYSTVMDHEDLYELWKIMWIDDEFEIVQDRIREMHKTQDPATRTEKIMRNISDLKLKCNVVNHCWEIISMW